MSSPRGTLDVLSLVGRAHREVSLADLAETLNLPKATVLRHASALLIERFLVRTESGSFGLGPAAWALQGWDNYASYLSAACRRALDELSKATGETAVFTTDRTGSTLVLTQVLRGHTPVKLPSGHIPTDRSAFGQALLAWWRLHQPVNPDEPLDAGLHQVIERGYAVEWGQCDPRLATLAVPIFSFGHPSFSIGIVTRRRDLTPHQAERLAPQLTEAANQVASDMAISQHGRAVVPQWVPNRPARRAAARTANPQLYAGTASIKVAQLLSLVGSIPGQRWNTAELCAATGWPDSTVRRHLATLVETRYANRNRDGRYSLGPEVWLLETEPRFVEQLTAAAYLPLGELRDATGETAVLTLLRGPDAQCLADATSRRRLVAQIPEGGRLSAHLSAHGRAVLSQLSHTDRERYCPALLGAERLQFHEDLDRIALVGLASDSLPPPHEAAETDALAAPIPGVSQLAAIGILAPASRMAAAPPGFLAEAVTAAAAAVADGLAQGRAQRVAERNQTRV